MYRVIFYEKADGTVPVEAFLSELRLKLREKVMRSIQLLQESGPLLCGEESKHIRDGVFELRTIFGSDITRVFYFFFAGGNIVLTNGFIKKTQKTPRRELERALRYKRDWERRNVDEDL